MQSENTIRSETDIRSDTDNDTGTDTQSGVDTATRSGAAARSGTATRSGAAARSGTGSRSQRRARSESGGRAGRAREPAELVRIGRQLAERIERLRFAAPVCCTYDPLVYAREPHERYLMRFGAAPKEVLFVGMNPGPFGMVQTGVPFGDVTMVRDWLGVEGSIRSPAHAHPKRPVLGFGCERSEVSGSRLWGWARDRFGTPERFFARFFVANYCPLAFVEESGRNRTPDKLAPAERERLFAICDDALRAVVDYFEPRLVIGIGGFAERRAREALAARTCAVGAILHPSPANPLANRGWAGVIEGQLAALGVAV